LDHPKIITIHDIAEVEGTHFIVMQYVEGKTLRELMHRGRLELSKTLHYATQVAEGLSRAHDKGIVHRDLKPANIMVTEDGLVKILDFGLAKLAEPGEQSEASTKDLDLKTKEGHVLGTAPYMSPEQAQAKKVDHRSDIFSFGSVLYEMVSGRRPFVGESTPEVLTAILREEPNKVSELLTSVPMDLDRVISRALRKEPERRFQSMADVRVELQEIKEDLELGSFVSARQMARAAAKRGGRYGPWVGAGLIAVGMVSIALWLYLRPAPLPPVRTVPLTSFTGQEYDPALSPDGDQVAFTWAGEAGDVRNLYVMMADGGEPLLISSGSDHTFDPTWSPDGTEIAFIRHVEGVDGDIVDGLFVVSALGGRERRIGTFTGQRGLSWSPNGRLLAIPHQEPSNAPSCIYLVSLETGEKEKLTTVLSHPGDSRPRFSPDGKTVAFQRGGATDSDIYLVSVKGGEPRRLTSGNNTTRGLDWTQDGKSIVFSAARSGRAGFWSLWRVSVSGGEPEPLEVGEPGSNPIISRRHDRLAYVRQDDNWNIWRVGGPNAQKGDDVSTRHISSSRLDYTPFYSPDGKSISFTSGRSGFLEIWICDSDGSNVRQLTFFEHAVTLGGRWSPGGQKIAFMSTKEGNLDIYSVEASGGLPVRIMSENWDEMAAIWSRNGRWIYFGSKQTGRPEIYKMPVEGGVPVQLTKHGGTAPIESDDGEFLYYGKQNPSYEGSPGVWRIPVGGGEEEQILGEIVYGPWTLFEQSIVYACTDSESGAAIDRFDLQKKEVTRIATLEHLPIRTRFSVSPDGRWILYVVSESESDIMLVENFR
jgi:Tol biopolymer transport system component